MTPPPLLFDGLRKCLCPGVTRAHWLAVMRGPNARRASAALKGGPPRSYMRSTRTRQTRAYSVSASHLLGADNDATLSSVAGLGDSTLQSTTAQTVLPDGISSDAKRLLEVENLNAVMLGTISTEDVEMAIRVLRQPDPTILCGIESTKIHQRIIDLATFLVTKRNLRTSVFIYESIMDAMADPKGSAYGALKLLLDMDKAGLPLTENICRSALKVLTVHPHYSLQAHILSVMRDKWFDITMPDVQNIILGLLRDNQDDLAFQRFMEMIHAGTEPEIWLYDVVAMTLGSRRLFDEMLEVFQQRTRRQKTGDAYVNLVYHMLDCCSSGFHHAGTAVAWDVGVNGGLFEPSDGILDNVLSTAATNGDQELAHAAYELLSSRTRVTDQQYAALMEAFCTSSDVLGAFRFLSIVEATGTHSTALEVMIDVLRLHLRPVQGVDVFDEASEAIKTLAADGHPVKRAVNTLVRAMLQAKGGEGTIDFMREMQQAWDETPDEEIMRSMIKYTEDLELRRIFIQKYYELFPEPTNAQSHPTTYRLLILACLDVGEIDLATRFALEFTLLPNIPASSLNWTDQYLESAWRAKDKRLEKVFGGLMSSPAVPRERKVGLRRTLDALQSEHMDGGDKTEMAEGVTPSGEEGRQDALIERHSATSSSPDEISEWEGEDLTKNGQGTLIFQEGSRL